MTRFVEYKRLPNLADPLPGGLVEAAKFRPDEATMGRSRIALSAFFQEKDFSEVADKHVLRLIQAWPAHAWEAGTDVPDLELYIGGTLRVVKGQEPEKVGDSLGMHSEDYGTWWEDITANLSQVISFRGLTQAAGLRAVANSYKNYRESGIQDQPIGHMAQKANGYHTPDLASIHAPKNNIAVTEQQPDDPLAFYRDFLKVSAARVDQGRFDALLSDHIDMIRFKTSKYFLAGGEHQDLVQEGMIGFYKAVKDYNGSGSSFRSFAELCVTRQILTAIKTATRFKHAVLNTYVSFELNPPGETGESGLTLGDSFPSTEPSVSETVESNESLAHIVRTLGAKLTSLEGNTLKLYLDGESYENMAAELGVDTKSIDNAFQRVKRKIIAAREDQDFVSPLLNTV